jgi:hypothetical protein
MHSGAPREAARGRQAIEALTAFHKWETRDRQAGFEKLRSERPQPNHRTESSAASVRPGEIGPAKSIARKLGRSRIPRMRYRMEDPVPQGAE